MASIDLQSMVYNGVNLHTRTNDQSSRKPCSFQVLYDYLFLNLLHSDWPNQKLLYKVYDTDSLILVT